MAYYWNKNGNVMDREMRREESKAFFTNLRQLADRNELTNKELASVLDISLASMYNYLGGDVVPREEAFESMKRRAVDFFDISITELLSGNFDDNREEVITAEPVEVEEDRTESTVLTEMLSAINKRKAQVAKLQKEIDALENALTLMQADKLS